MASKLMAIGSREALGEECVVIAPGAASQERVKLGSVRVVTSLKATERAKGNLVNFKGVLPRPFKGAVIE